MEFKEKVLFFFYSFIVESDLDFEKREQNEMNQKCIFNIHKNITVLYKTDIYIYMFGL